MHRWRLLLALVGLSLVAVTVAHAQSSPPPRVPATPRDLFLPGTQPHQLVDSITAPQQCFLCHAGYATQTGQPHNTETWVAWQGSMMAQAGRDPLFFAALDIANADVDGGGEFCLRCHMPAGWLEGRSAAPDGSAMTADDQEGISCAVCHRMVDLFPAPENPARDTAVYATLTAPVTVIGSGSIIFDPADYRRGPRNVVADLGLDPHLPMGAQDTQISPYHRESAFCGSCHDIDNPLFSWDEATQSYQPNPYDTPGEPGTLFAIERTYSEWEQSAFNSPQGIYLPQFGGNDHTVSSCQDCHMPKITGSGGSMFGNHVVRNDLATHDLTGANTWVPTLIPQLPEYAELFAQEPGRLDALDAGVERARTMLQNAAVLDVYRNGSRLVVTVTNQTGHKLPSGYLEGRRMWLQVRGYDAANNLIYASGAYDAATGELTHDPELKVYEAHQGLTADWAAQVGLPAGPSFHFILNNAMLFDNRIPPIGYRFAAFEAVQAAPVTDGRPDPGRYADGQFWDTTVYTLPEGVARGEVRLLYQVASREYIEFLRDNNPNPGQNRGDVMFALWAANGRSGPELMAQKSFGLNTSRAFLPTIR